MRVHTSSDTLSDGCLKIRRYETFGGEEYFLSFETQDEKKVFGFLRLRLRDSDLWSKGRSSLQLDDDTKLNLCQTFPELIGCGLIRELHIYGQLVGSHERKTLNDLRWECATQDRFTRFLRSQASAHWLRKEATCSCGSYQRCKGVSEDGSHRRNWYERLL